MKPKIADKEEDLAPSSLELCHVDSTYVLANTAWAAWLRPHLPTWEKKKKKNKQPRT